VSHQPSAISHQPSSTRPVVAILYGPGINCHEETAFAVQLAGLDAKVVNFHDVMEGKDALTKYQALVVPGGFSWGDHLGSGRIFGLHLIARAADQLKELVDTGKPILGICNGFQILVETGLLPDGNVGKRGCALLQNKSAVLESRWVDLLVTDTNSIWTQGLEGRILRMPVAHGEGRLFWENSGSAFSVQRSASTHQPSTINHSVIRPVVCYSKDGRPTEEYPACPSGSPGGIAGICDSTGLIFGLMPHPERASLAWHGSSDGMQIFTNLAKYLRG
jgi:phosphoribosylformylglycinamidine synthase